MFVCRCLCMCSHVCFFPFSDANIGPDLSGSKNIYTNPHNIEQKHDACIKSTQSSIPNPWKSWRINTINSNQYSIITKQWTSLKIIRRHKVEFGPCQIHCKTNILVSGSQIDKKGCQTHEEIESDGCGKENPKRNGISISNMKWDLCVGEIAIVESIHDMKSFGRTTLTINHTPPPPNN